LANVSTNGFKKSHAVFEDLMYQNLRQVGSSSTEQSTLPTGLQIGLGVRTVATSRTFSQGNLNSLLPRLAKSSKPTPPPNPTANPSTTPRPPSVLSPSAPSPFILLLAPLQPRS
jgi:hypothetical protein